MLFRRRKPAVEVLSGAGKQDLCTCRRRKGNGLNSFRRRQAIALILSGAGSDNLCTWNISTKLLPGAGRQDLCTQRQASLSGQKKGSKLSHRLYGSGNGKWHSRHITSCSSCSISNFSRVCRLEDGEAIFFVRIQNSYLPLLKTALNKAYLVMLSMQEKKLAVS